MRVGVVLVALGVVALGGCLRSVQIPQQEAALKDACHGKDQILAHRGNVSIYRCGEGDQARYAAYVDGQLTKEANEVLALGAAAEVGCMNSGYAAGSREHTECVKVRHAAALATAGQIRANENATAEEKRRRALIAVAAVGAAAAAGAAAASAAQPAYQPAPAPVRLQTNCTSSRVGNFVNTNCF